MYNGVMRYDLSDTKMSALPGKYGYMVQVSKLVTHNILFIFTL